MGVLKDICPIAPQTRVHVSQVSSSVVISQQHVKAGDINGSLALTGMERAFLLVPDVTKGPLTSSRRVLR